MGTSGVDPRWNASVKRKLPLWALMSLFVSTSLPVSLGSSSSAQGHASSWTTCNVTNITPKKTQLSDSKEEEEVISNDVTHAASNSRSRGANHATRRTRNSSNHNGSDSRPTHRQPPSSSWTRRSLLESESEQSDDDLSSSSSSLFSEDEREQRIISALASATAKDHQDETMAHHKQPRQHRRTHSSYRNDVEVRSQKSGPRKRRRKQTQKIMIHPSAQTDGTGSDAKNDLNNPVDSGPFSRNGNEGITKVEDVSSNTIPKGKDHTSHQSQSEDIALGPKATSTLSPSRYYTPQAQTSQSTKDDSVWTGTERGSIPSRDPVPSNNSTQSRLSTLPRDIPSLAGSGASLSGTVGASSTQNGAASYPEKPIFGTRGTPSAPSSPFTSRWRSANSNTASASTTTPVTMEQNRPNNNMLQSEHRPTDFS
eukprot:scaffold33692_cov59-Attheya_sp.AAC.1